jgi:hypothetical protein
VARYAFSLATIFDRRLWTSSLPLASRPPAIPFCMVQVPVI